MAKKQILSLSRAHFPLADQFLSKPMSRPEKPSLSVLPTLTELRTMQYYLYIFFDEKGVHTGGNFYTSPVLSLHTYYKSATSAQIDMAGGTVNTIYPRRSKNYKPDMLYRSKEAGLSLDEQVQLIVVEDIISISYRTDITKNVKTEIKSTSVQNGQGCSSCCSWWCCCKPDKKHQHAIAENKAADRVIVVTVEYVRHSNLHTSSHIRILADDDRVAFFRDRMNVDILQFYLYSSKEFDHSKFDERRRQAETLCRLVVQLKQMGLTQYPSEAQLAQIVHRNHIELFGDESHEDLPALMVPIVQTTINRVQRPQIKAVSDDQF